MVTSAHKALLLMLFPILCSCVNAKRNDLELAAKERYKLYLVCMNTAAEYYSTSKELPETLAEAAHSACAQEFSNFHKATEAFYLSTVSGSSRAIVIEDTIKQMPTFEKRGKQKVIQKIIESRMAN